MRSGELNSGAFGQLSDFVMFLYCVHENIVASGAFYEASTGHYAGFGITVMYLH